MKKKFNPKKIKHWAFLLLSLMAMTLALGIYFSPYRFHDGKKMVKNSVIVNAPVEKVFNYLGNSANAAKWSVFVDHISPLPNGVPDGQAGSLRRCFCNKNETGKQWDEEITLVEKNRRRQLRIYNLVNFPMTTEGLGTEQLYERINAQQTRLTFTVFYLEGEPCLWNEFKTYFAAYKMQHIFVRNMDNIKQLIEKENG